MQPNEIDSIISPNLPALPVADIRRSRRINLTFAVRSYAERIAVGGDPTNAQADLRACFQDLLATELEIARFNASRRASRILEVQP